MFVTVRLFAYDFRGDGRLTLYTLYFSEKDEGLDANNEGRMGKLQQILKMWLYLFEKKDLLMVPQEF